MDALLLASCTSLTLLFPYSPLVKVAVVHSLGLLGYHGGGLPPVAGDRHVVGRVFSFVVVIIAIAIAKVPAAVPVNGGDEPLGSPQGLLLFRALIPASPLLRPLCSSSSLSNTSHCPFNCASASLISSSLNPSSTTSCLIALSSDSVVHPNPNSSSFSSPSPSLALADVHTVLWASVPAQGEYMLDAIPPPPPPLQAKVAIDPAPHASLCDIARGGLPVINKYHKNWTRR